MKKVIIGAVTAVLLGVGAGAALAANSDKATGGIGSPGAAANGNVPFNLEFTAQNSASPSGTFQFRRADGSFKVASVSCYSQSGNEAGFSGIITSTSGIFADPTNASYVAPGSTGYAAVQDNGQGANSPPDMVQVDIGPQYATNCAPGPFPYTVTSGNVLVHQGESQSRRSVG